MTNLNLGEAVAELIENAEPLIDNSDELLIIEGVRKNGSQFRPSDWSERISSTYACFGRDHRLRYAKGIQPRMINGQKVLTIKPSLQWKNPLAFAAVMKFAEENELNIKKSSDI